MHTLNMLCGVNKSIPFYNNKNIFLWMSFLKVKMTLDQPPIPCSGRFRPVLRGFSDFELSIRSVICECSDVIQTWHELEPDRGCRFRLHWTSVPWKLAFNKKYHTIKWFHEWYNISVWPMLKSWRSGQWGHVVQQYYCTFFTRKTILLHAKFEVLKKRNGDMF